MTSSRPVFVVGMPRSGTTVTRSLLDAHPSLAVAPETHFVDHWMRAHRKADLSTADGFATFWASYTSSRDFEVLELDAATVAERVRAAGPPSFQNIFTTLLAMYAEARGKSRAGEKTPGHYRYLDVLFHWFPDARVVFLVRDPRAVVASFQVKAQDVAWADKAVDVIAVRWRRSIEIAERWGSDPRVTVVRYEGLVDDPAREIGRVCEWLEEPFTPSMLTDARDAPRGWEASKAHGAVSASSVERWRSELSEEDVRVVEYLARGPMARLGYEPSLSPLPRFRQATLEGKALLRRRHGVVERLRQLVP